MNDKRSRAVGRLAYRQAPPGFVHRPTNLNLPCQPLPASSATSTPSLAARAASVVAEAIPLAERLRPQTLADVIGQRHLPGPGKPMRTTFQVGRPHSMILWGPPGTGKTTLARLMAPAFNAHLVQISAVLGGVRDIRSAVEQTQASHARGRLSIVFVDETHRFNKAVKCFVNQRLGKSIVQFLVLPRCSMEGTHG